MFYANLIKEVAAQELLIGIDGLCKVIPKLRSLIDPIITTSYELHGTKGRVDKKVLASISGLWQTSISVNAQTKLLHTENDATYTILSVPK